jgi:hypothetical protein
MLKVGYKSDRRKAEWAKNIINTEKEMETAFRKGALQN